jgi:hypothetical protein
MERKQPFTIISGHDSHAAPANNLQKHREGSSSCAADPDPGTVFENMFLPFAKIQTDLSEHNGRQRGGENGLKLIES